MICCDKCRDKQKATHMIGWNNNPMQLEFTNCIALCDKCYVDFMASFGNFKGEYAKLFNEKCTYTSEDKKNK